MKKSKLILLLRQLTSRQLNRLEDFLNSPYFNKNKDIISFFQYLKVHYPDFSGQNLDKDQILKHLHLSKPIDEKSLTYLMNHLIVLTEKFLIHEEISNDRDLPPTMLVKAFQQLGLDKQAGVEIEKLKKLIKTETIQNAGHFRRRFELATIDYNLSDPHQRSFDPGLQEAGNWLDIWFITEKLRIRCKMLSLKETMDVEYTSLLPDELFELAEKTDWAGLTAVKIYFHAWKMLKNETVDDFELLALLLENENHIISLEEQKELFTLALNFCALQINRYNNKQFYQAYFKIIRLLLDRGLIYDHGELSPWYYINIVNVALKSEDPDWALQFIKDHKSKLPPVYAENLYLYNLAQINYHLQHYREVQTALLQVEFQDMIFAMAARSLLIKLYFETDQSELLFNALEANRIWLLRNKKVAAGLHLQMRNFVDYTRKLAKSELYTREQILSFIKALPDAEVLMHRDWLEAMAKKRL